MSSLGGADWGGGFPSSGFPNRIRNGRRKAAGGFPTEKGCAEYDLDLEHQAAYVGELEWGDFQKLVRIKENTPYLAKLTMARFVITTCIEFPRLMYR